jgi:dihydroorotate dehydrogenase electron transfer subunit
MVGNRDGRDYLPRPLGMIERDGRRGFIVDRASAAGDLAGPVLHVLGPLGTGFSLTGLEAERTLLVAGGFGATVLPGVVTRLRGARVISGFRQAAQATLLDLLDGAACDPPVIEPDRITAPLDAALVTRDYTCVVAAGPSGLGRAVAEVCAHHGVASQIALEAPMACGFGACFGCVVEIDGTYQRSCIEGPVVDGARLLP